MIVLIHGAKNSNCENGAEKIIAALASYSYTRFGKETLVLQFTNSHPVERVLSGKDVKTTTINTGFVFKDNGIDALWKRVRAGSLDKEEWKDCTKSFAKISVAEVSENEEFEKNILSDMEATKQLLLSADENFDLVFVFTKADSTELNEALRTAEVNGRKIISKEVVVVNQAPKAEPEENVSFIVRNFDYDSVFTLKRMIRELGSKAVYPIAYNTNFKDAYLNENVLFFVGSNKEPDKDNENYRFVEDVVKAIEHIIGASEPLMEEKNFSFRRSERKL